MNVTFEGNKPKSSWSFGLDFRIVCTEEQIVSLVPDQFSDLFSDTERPRSVGVPRSYHG